MSSFAGTLLRASLEGGLFAGVVWLLLQLVPRAPAALRCWLWWAVSLKFLLGLVGLPGLELPVLPAVSVAVAAPSAVPTVSLAMPSAATISGGATDLAPGVSGAWAPTVLFTLWLLGVVVAAVLLLRDVGRLRRLLANARRVEDPSLAGLFAELCGRFRLRSTHLLVSPHVVSPQVLGLTQARVLVPQVGLAQLSTAELAMVLAHELAHVVRGDLLLGWVPTLARRLFFFHPLAALATREYALAREAACDAEVIRVLGSAPRSYGRLLLQWGVVPRETGLAAAAAAPSLRLLKRRLSMLDHVSSLSGRRRVAWWLAAGAVALGGLVPLKLVAQSSRTHAVPPVPAPAPIPAVAPAPAPAPVAVASVAPVPALPAPVALAAAPTPPTPPTPPSPPRPPSAVARTGSHGDGHFSYSYSTGHDGTAWVYLKGDSGAIMSGSTEDLQQAKTLRQGSDQPLFLFRNEGKLYVVRDAEVLAQIERIYEPVNQLGAKQGAIGEKQGELGAQQGAIGAQQGALGARQGALGARLGELASRQALGRGDKSLDAEMEKLSAEMDRLGDEMEKLGEPMEKFGEQMEAYGEQMEALGKQMEAASDKAERELRSLIDKTMASGLAEVVQ